MPIYPAHLRAEAWGQLLADQGDERQAVWDGRQTKLDALRAECSGLTVELGLVAAERDAALADVVAWRGFASSVAVAVHPGDAGLVIADHLAVDDLPDLFAAVERVVMRAEKAEANYAWMVERAAAGADGGPGLDGYRELGARALVAEERREEAEAERDALRAQVAQLHADRAVLVTVMVTSAPPDLLQEVLPADPGEVLSVVRALTLMVIESPDHRGIIAYVRALMARMEAEQLSALGGDR